MSAEGPLFRIVDYRYPDRATEFSPQQLDYIESTHAFMDERQLDKIRRFEHFRLNQDLGCLTAREIPGLRPSPDNAVVYVRRFGSARYVDMADLFLDLVLDDSWGREIRACIMRPYRITLPTGDRYYPFVIGVDPASWRQRFRDAAAALNTPSAEFDRGRFVLSDGRTFAFNELELDVADPDDLATW